VQKRTLRAQQPIAVVPSLVATRSWLRKNKASGMACLAHFSINSQGGPQEAFASSDDSTLIVTKSL